MITSPRFASAAARVSTLYTRHSSRAFAILAVLILLPLAWLRPLDDKAGEYVQRGLKQALITFGVARAANAVISLAQESTVSVSASVVVGGSATIAVGQILDPVNDLVESFSNLMLAACISFGIQAALLEMGKTAFLTWSVTALLLGWALAKWFGRPPPVWLAKALVLILIARFAVPVAAMGSEMTYQLLLGEKHQAAQAGLSLATTSLESQAKQLDTNTWRDYLDPKVWKAYVENMKARAEAWVENAVRVMAVFLIQTVVLPLLFLWLTVWLAKELFGWRLRVPALPQNNRPPLAN